jgi:cytochrome bd-type quinol oxidase subunit 1
MSLAIYTLLVMSVGLHFGYYGLREIPAEPAVRPRFMVALAVTLASIPLSLIVGVIDSPPASLGRALGEVVLLAMVGGVVVFGAVFVLGLGAGRLLRRYRPPTRPSPVRLAFGHLLPALTIRVPIGGLVGSRVVDTGARRARDQTDPVSELLELLAEREAAGREPAEASTR